MLPFKNEVNIPTTDVFTKDNSLAAEAHLPNFEQKDVTIEAVNGAFVISVEFSRKKKIKASNVSGARKFKSCIYRWIAPLKRADTENII